jgi:hypothetical protein
MTRPVEFLSCPCPIIAVTISAIAQGPLSPPAVPVEPIAAIIEVFQSHALVTLSSHHRNEQREELESTESDAASFKRCSVVATGAG